MSNCACLCVFQFGLSATFTNSLLTMWMLSEDQNKNSAICLENYTVNLVILYSESIFCIIIGWRAEAGKVIMEMNSHELDLSPDVKCVDPPRYISWRVSFVLLPWCYRHLSDISHLPGLVLLPFLKTPTYLPRNRSSVILASREHLLGHSKESFKPRSGKR